MKGFLKGNKGFTLIEIILSIAILGIIMVPLSSYFMRAIGNNKDAKEKMIANQVAQKYMEMTKAGTLPVPILPKDGEYNQYAEQDMTVKVKVSSLAGNTDEKKYTVTSVESLDTVIDSYAAVIYLKKNVVDNKVYISLNKEITDSNPGYDMDKLKDKIVITNDNIAMEMNLSIGGKKEVSPLRNVIDNQDIIIAVKNDTNSNVSLNFDISGITKFPSVKLHAWNHSIISNILVDLKTEDSQTIDLTEKVEVIVSKTVGTTTKELTKIEGLKKN